VARKDRAARTRRIARLLVALGEPPVAAVAAATRLSRRVADGPRGEQLAIIEHRERTAGGGDRTHEAWVLRHVLGWNERDAARALDCSRTALRLHLGNRPRRSAEEDERRIAEIRARMMEITVGAVPDTSSAVPERHRVLLGFGLVVAILTLLAIATRFLR
jgi:hypothetical protein